MISLTKLEKILYQSDSCISEEDVPLIMKVVREEATWEKAQISWRAGKIAGLLSGAHSGLLEVSEKLKEASQLCVELHETTLSS